MKHSIRLMKFKLATVLLGGAVLLAVLAGCGKEKAQNPASPKAAAESTATPTEAVPVPVAVAPAPAAPDARLIESDAAFKAREYEKAVEVLLAAKRAKLSEQQAAAAAAQMRQFQSGLADAVASGDPRAKAAADKLRQAAMNR